MEEVHGVMAELQKQNAENFKTLTKQQFDTFQSLAQGTKTTTGMTHTRTIGRPMSFTGDEGKDGEWESETLGVLACRCPELRLVDPMVREAADCDLAVSF